MTATLTVFFFTLPVGMGLDPVGRGRARSCFTPTTSRCPDRSYTADELLASSSAASPRARCWRSRSFCVDEYLPVALTIVDVDVVEEEPGRSRSTATASRWAAPTSRRRAAAATNVLTGPRYDGGLPFEPIRNTVYTAAELFAGLRPARPESYGETTDFRSYPVVRRDRPQHPDGSRRGDRCAPCTMRSVTFDLGDVIAGRRVVGIMGGHQLPRDSDDVPQHRRAGPRPRPARHAGLHRRRPGRDGGRRTSERRSRRSRMTSSRRRSRRFAAMPQHARPHGILHRTERRNPRWSRSRTTGSRRPGR